MGRYGLGPEKLKIIILEQKIRQKLRKTVCNDPNLPKIIKIS
jgi:hypothetical protein